MGRYPTSLQLQSLRRGFGLLRPDGRWAAQLQYLETHCARSARAALPTAAVQVPLAPLVLRPLGGLNRNRGVLESTGTLLCRQCEFNSGRNRQMFEPAFGSVAWVI